MSIGFGVGDLLAVINLATTVIIPPSLYATATNKNKVYARFVSAPDSYKKLKFAFNHLRNVLKSIQETWEQQETFGYVLPRDKQQDLRQYTDSCQRVIREVDQFVLKNPRKGDDHLEIFFRTKHILSADAVKALQEDLDFYKNCLKEVHDLILYA
jgi:hypothetical protein